MDVNNVLINLIRRHNCLPAIKLAWNNQVQLPEGMELPKINHSKYIEEINTSTEERHVLLLEQQKKMDFWKTGFELMVIPSLVVFQKYTGGDEQSVTITIRNISSQMQKVSLVMDSIGAFRLDKASQRVSRLASGMTFTVNILFNPADDMDYFDKLIFATAKCRFALPLMGIASTGILDLPDKIKFENVPVKYFKTKDISCINVGKKTARFTVTTEGPFCASPEKGVVLPNDCITFSVSFLEDIKTVAHGSLKIKYENGEEVYAELEGESVDANIIFKPTDLEFPETFIGLQNKMKLTIQNNSDFKSNFSWRKYLSPTVSLMEGVILHPHDGSGDAGSNPHGRLFSISGRHEEVLRSSVKHINEPLYCEDYFSIEPPTGDIQPHSSIELTVIFSPTQIGMHLSEAFCDIVGLEERVEARLTGRAVGPKFQLGFDELNIGNIYIGGGHTYEIPVRNTSAIEGVIVFDSNSDLTRSTLIKVEPSFIKLSPDQCSAFYMFFDCAGQPGDFYEELHFKVPSTGEIVCLTVVGEVLYPRLEFNVEVLDMGDVSIGFTKSKAVIMVNKSMNNIHVELSMDKDGTERCLSFEEILKSFSVDDFEFPFEPKEFEIIPSNFTLMPLGYQRLDVHLTPSAFYNYERCIQVRVQGESDVMKELPLNACCIAPTFLTPTEEIVLPECYTGFPYTEYLVINNPSELQGVFCFVPRFSSKMRMESDSFVGVAKARGQTSVPFSVTCDVPGEHTNTIELYCVGKEDPITEYNIRCRSVESKLHATTKILNFGHINILTPCTRSFELINGTPRELNFDAHLLTRRNLGDTWKVLPEEGTIPGDSKHPIQLQLTLGEVGPFVGSMHVSMRGTSNYVEVKVAATGVGCSLEFSPPIDESGKIDFGYTFTNTLRSFTYVITNRGNTPKLLEWRRIDEDPVVNPNLVVPEQQDKSNKNQVKRKSSDKTDKETRKGSKNKKDKPKGRKTSKTSKTKKIKPYFEVTPRKQLVKPEETMTVVFKTSASFPATPEESYILWAYTPSPPPSAEKAKAKAPKNKMKEKIAYHQAIPVAAKTVHLIGQFVTPKLTVSKSYLFFKIDPTPMERSYIRRQTLEIKNDCQLPLATKLVTTYPFSITEDEEEVSELFAELEPNMQKQIQITFDGSHLRKNTDNYKFDSKLQIIFYELSSGGESVILRGEVYFPTVEISRSEIDFGTVFNGTETIEEFVVHNNEKYCLTFKMYLKPNSTIIEPNLIRAKKVMLHPSSLQTQFSKATYSISNLSQASAPPNTVQHLTLPSAEEIAESNQIHKTLNVGFLDLEPQSSAETDLSKDGTANNEELSLSWMLDNQIEQAQFYRSKLHRARVLGIIGLHDPEREPIDDVAFFHKHPGFQAKMMGPYAPLEIVDVVPMSGVIQSGHSQRFTVVFYAEPNIDFTTELCCFVENGTSKYIKITGKSTPTK